MSEGTAHWRVARWAMVSIVLGVACGLAAVALGWLTVGAEVLHQQQPWLQPGARPAYTVRCAV